MRSISFEAMARLVADHRNSWSIGGFGALGEFCRDAEEPCEQYFGHKRIQLATARGAIRLVRGAFPTIAWDSLSADGIGWSHSLALCVPRLARRPNVLHPVGPDFDAILRGDRGALLFDLGVTLGQVRMCIRTRDELLAATLAQATGQNILNMPGLLNMIVRSQPHRVLLSPSGRIEVFAPIPPPHGVSPQGPHTHLMPRLIAAQRLHSANDPIPEGYEAALMMHPPRPWTGPRTERRFCPTTNAAFAGLLETFSCTDDLRIRDDILAAFDGLTDAPAWPVDRRGRAKARITLRRLAAAGHPRAEAWREQFDRCGLPAFDASNSTRQAAMAD